MRFRLRTTEAPVAITRLAGAAVIRKYMDKENITDAEFARVE